MTNLIESIERDQTVKLTLKEDRSYGRIKVYNARLLRDLNLGTVFNGSNELVNFSMKAGDYVTLTETKYNRGKAEWLLTQSGHLDPHPIQGLKVRFGDTDIMQRAVFIRKKWLD